MHRPMVQAPMPSDIPQSGQNEVPECIDQGPVASGTFCASLPMVTWNTPEFRLANGLGRRKDSLEYKTWASMVQRCTNPQADSYPSYGGRGIKVCQRWREDFMAFLSDVGSRPSAEHSLDRIDVNGDYEPGNCRWATAKEQHRNRRNNHQVSAFGETKPIAAWIDDARCVVEKGHLRSRIKSGWSAERAMTTPVKHYTTTGGGA